MLQICTLQNTPFEAIFNAWNDAFSEYERGWTYDELKKMLHRRSYNPTLSFGAFEDSNLVGFILNGTGSFNNLRTAYDTGTGVIKSHRGQGLTTRIFNESLPLLQTAGMQQYLLEVLSKNDTAIGIYSKAGFATSRTFNYYIQPVSHLKLLPKTLPEDYVLKEASLAEVSQCTSMWDFIPSWQNNSQSINNKPEDFRIASVYNGDNIAGYGIVEATTGDIPQLAVADQHRRKGIGTTLLTALQQYNKQETLRFINTDAGCVSMTAFLKNNNINLSGTQLEMIIPIGVK